MKTAEQGKFMYGTHRYNYYLIREHRKSISLTVKPDKTLLVKCPEHATEDRINEFLKRKWKWLDTKIQFFDSFACKEKPNGRLEHGTEYVSGESLLYLGRQYKLIVEHSEENKVVVEPGRIIVKTLHHHDKVVQSVKVRNVLKMWYHKQTRKIFHERFKLMLKRFELDYMPQLRIMPMTRRWGSFVSDSKIILNSSLIYAHKECIDYVIVHELCHLRYKNHSKYFWALLDAKYPSWKKVKERLEKRVYGG
ncbi:MAG: M48 family metallopeptidase [Patescibacteria group bacterium]